MASPTAAVDVPASRSGRMKAAVAPLSWLHGTWLGTGQGQYPTLKSGFTYHEEIIITAMGGARPVLRYQQRSWSTQGGKVKPMHEEQGWVRVLPNHFTAEGQQRVEVVLAAQNGMTTVEEGYVKDGCGLVLHSTSLAHSSTSRTPRATAFRRVFKVDQTADPPSLHITMDLATTNTPELTRHLECVLHRQSVVPSPLSAVPSMVLDSCPPSARGSHNNFATPLDVPHLNGSLLGSTPGSLTLSAGSHGNGGGVGVLLSPAAVNGVLLHQHNGVGPGTHSSDGSMTPGDGPSSPPTGILPPGRLSLATPMDTTLTNGPCPMRSLSGMAQQLADLMHGNGSAINGCPYFAQHG